LLGADLDVFDIGAIDEGDFYVKLMLRDKSDGFKFALYGVYGPVQQNRKEVFLSEMAHICSKESLPFVIAGDFNIMRHPDDKNTDNFNTRWPNLFNAVIETLQLKEFVMSGRQYMWAGPGDNPTYEKLDRVLVSTEWEHNYPLSTVESRDRNISDHTPLILNIGASTHQNRQSTFKFEKGWLTRDGFFDMVANIWQSECRGYTALERWQNKIRNLRQYLRGQLDKKAETSILSDNEINMKHYIKERLVTLLREEEIKWYERAKVQNLLQGNDNTRFFHLIASNKRQKQCIFRLEQEDGIIVGDNELKRYITRYYKNLFGQPVEIDIHLDESRIDDIPQVTNIENEILTSPFTMDDIKEAVFQMEHNKAPGPDGFPAKFYQVFWEIIKEDLLALF
jgi:hypothetical protein